MRLNQSDTAKKGIRKEVAENAAGKDKAGLIENKEYGYCPLLKATNPVLEQMKMENVTKAKVTSTKRVEKIW